MRQLDDKLNITDSLVNAKRPELAIDFDTNTDRNAVRQRNLSGDVVSTDQIADNAITSAKIYPLTIQAGDIANGVINSTKLTGTISDKLITGGTIGTAVIGTSQITGGTVTSLIGTSQITGGSIGVNVGTLNNMIMGTPTITGGQIAGSISSSVGTLNNMIMGSPTITGGTLVPTLYKFGTFSGFTGTIGYLTAGTVKGSMTFQGGLLVGTS